MPERGFLIFWNFLLFFSKFSCPGQVWMEFGTKIFFSSFSAYLIQFWLEIMLELGFLIFFATFFAIFFSRPIMNGIRDKNFSLSFLAYLIPFWLKIMPERGILMFWIFFLLFLEFSSLGKVWTEFGTKMFFSFSACLIPVSAINNAGMRFFNFFAIFFPIFFLGPSMNGIR